MQTSLTEYGVSSPDLVKEIKENCLKKGCDLDWQEIQEKLPKISQLLAVYGFGRDWIDYTLLTLSQIDETIPGFLSTDFDKFLTMIQREDLQTLSPLTLQILLCNFLDDDEMLNIEEFRKKLILSLNNYSQTHPENPLEYGVASNETVKFTEEEAIAIASGIVFAFMESGLQMAYDNYGGPIYRQKGRQSDVVGSEFFRDKENNVFVRCGYLFFVDSKYRRLIPKDVLEIAGNNIIYIKDMAKSEFNGRLGYFTCNTITTLMNVDLKGKTVVDCGSGTSNLSLALRKIGASQVIGIENDSKQLKKAVKNITANGEEGNITPLNLDLLHVNEVTEAVVGSATSNEIVIVANLGYWREYPISNLTCINLAKYFEEAGLSVTDVVTGGNDPTVGANHRDHESDFLNSCLNGRSEPRSGTEQDKLCLKSLGFDIATTSASEVIYRYGSFPRQAESVHGARK